MMSQKDRIEAAIRHIKTSVDIDPWAMELAVDALKAQGTCEDAVSRQTLQKELALYPIDDVTSEDEAGYNRAINDVQKMVLHLPSAHPEPMWIPCSERLPEDEIAYYLVTLVNHGLLTYGDVDIARWDYDRRKGKESWHWCKEREVIAWMPLPEPYKGGELE